MAVCRECGDEVEQMVKVRVGGKTRKMCEDCADRAREESEIAEAGERAIQAMMEYKGRR